MDFWEKALLREAFSIFKFISKRCMTRVLILFL